VGNLTIHLEPVPYDARVSQRVYLNPRLSALPYPKHNSGTSTSVSSTHSTRGTSTRGTSSTQRPAGASVRPSRPLGQALPALTGTRAGTGESSGAPTAALPATGFPVRHPLVLSIPQTLRLLIRRLHYSSFHT